MNIGLFFGSFNPVHIGHMAIANYLVEYAPIDKLWFVVTPQNPLKKKNSLLHDFDRFEMVKLAIGSDPRFEACDIEFNLPKPSYTIDTLTFLSEKHPRHTFLPIIGGDNYENLSKWKNFQVLLATYTIIVYPRPGCSKEMGYPGATIGWADAPLNVLSSTFIRQAISEGRDIRHFLPGDVYKYIKELGFYQKKS
jgi:nicotinate-nucleotide adenylyltransferase